MIEGCDRALAWLSRMVRIFFLSYHLSFLLQVTESSENYFNHKFSTLYLQFCIFVRPHPDPMKSQHSAWKEDRNFSDWSVTIKLNTTQTGGSWRPRPAPCDCALGISTTVK